MLVIVSHEHLSSREYTDIVHKRSRISQAASSVGTKNNLIDRHILESNPRRHLEALSGKPVTAKTCNCRELISCMEGIFTEYASVRKICDSFPTLALHTYNPIFSQEILIISVESTIKSESELMFVADNILVQEVGICGMLTCKILGGTEIRIHILIAIISDKCYILRIILVERNSYLEIAVDRAVEDI